MEQKLRDAAAQLPEASLSFDSIQPKPAKKIWKKVATIAACFVLLLGLSFGAYGCAAEIKEYNDAVEFFEENDLPTEGLSRREIKEVYRDITTASFTYSKTAEVIQNSIVTNHVGGYQIFQEAPTPEDVEKLWNIANGQYALQETHYVYHWDMVEKQHGNETFEAVGDSHMAKFHGETLVWDAVVTDYRIDGYKIVSDGLIVYGEVDDWYDAIDYPKMSKISDDGQVLWTTTLSNGFEDEYIVAVVENEDGSYAVFSRGDFKFLCCSQYSAAGKLLDFQKNEIGNYGIRTATRLGEDYIVLLSSFMTNEHAKIVKVDKDGNVAESFSYSSEDAYYYITDMIEFDGEIYLSAYSVPKLENEDENAGGRYEIAAIMNYLFDNHIWEISSEKLTPIVREHYTALLLICDPNGGSPREFYSVDGSFGNSLTVSDDGQLLWSVASIASTEYSPATSAYSLRGSCQVFRYSFAASGVLQSQDKTEEIIQFWK